MPFKPNIFISSTLDLKYLREDIFNLFKDLGAEPFVYEKNLTPSFTDSVYLDAIREADFVIFIFDKFYGSETKTGKSGTHEEFNLTKEIKVPFHIYINETLEESDDNNETNTDLKKSKLIEFLNTNIKNRSYSWYQYKGNDDLLKRIKETIFIISKEIYKYKIQNEEIDYGDLNKIVFIKDYEIALELIRLIEFFKDHYYNEDFIYYNIISEIFGGFNYVYVCKELFIDRKLREIYEQLYYLSDKFINLLYQNATNHNRNEEKHIINKREILIYRLDLFTHKEEWIDIETQLLSILNELFEKYEIFKKEIFKLKQEFEIKQLV